MAVTAARSTQADIRQDVIWLGLCLWDLSTHFIQRAGRADTFEVSGGKVAVVKNAISGDLPAQVLI